MQLAPPSPCHQDIVTYCDVWGEGGGALWGAKILQKIMAPPLSVIKIVKYCGVVEGGRGTSGAKIHKHNGVPALFFILLSIVASGEGVIVGGGGTKILLKIMTPIKINKYCGVGGGGKH